MIHIEEVSKESFNKWVDMGLELWPDNEKEDLTEIFNEIFDSEKETGFLYKNNNEYIGFINVSLRHDYVAGCDSSPVGYVEGVYVKEEYRENGIARELLKIGEEWATSKGCTEMGSDIEIDNNISYKFHEKCGFTEVEKVICFIKEIKK